MVLLDEVMRRPLDAGYQEAADRRRAGASPRGLHRVAILTALAVALGGGTAAAAVALRSPRDAVLTAREVLQDEILERREAADASARTIVEIDAEVEALQNAGLAEDYPALLAQIAEDSASAGTSAVRGPGLVVEVRDAVPLLGDGDDAAARVQDFDLQVVVNALWASGAQAISVNGHRLTTTSAIRSAGEAILVDLVGLSNPYRVEAVGDPATLPTYFARSAGQEHLTVLGSRYAISSDVRRADELTLPAGRVLDALLATTPGRIASSGPTNRPAPRPER